MEMLEKTAPKLSPRDVMAHMSQRLGAVLGDSQEPVLAFIIDNQVAVNIAADGDRLSVFCRIADVSQMSPKAWVAMLTEAANWGVDGESMRFAVIDPFVALMWSEPATDPDAMLERLQLVMSRAVAVARMVRRLNTLH
ncbi:MAG TPA: type III secretion system chaperone [Paraburkholderia sp.]|nr:type III secretion system chaperone [Paraburkholderia sp.]